VRSWLSFDGMDSVPIFLSTMGEARTWPSARRDRASRGNPPGPGERRRPPRWACLRATSGVPSRPPLAPPPRSSAAAPGPPRTSSTAATSRASGRDRSRSSRAEMSHPHGRHDIPRRKPAPRRGFRPEDRRMPPPTETGDHGRREAGTGSPPSRNSRRPAHPATNFWNP